MSKGDEVHGWECIQGECEQRGLSQGRKMSRESGIWVAPRQAKPRLYIYVRSKPEILGPLVQAKEDMKLVCEECFRRLILNQLHIAYPCSLACCKEFPSVGYTVIIMGSSVGLCIQQLSIVALLNNTYPSLGQNQLKQLSHHPAFFL